jgi:hypothetical protein
MPYRCVTHCESHRPSVNCHHKPYTIDLSRLHLLQLASCRQRSRGPTVMKHVLNMLEKGSFNKGDMRCKAQSFLLVQMATQFADFGGYWSRLKDTSLHSSRSLQSGAEPNDLDTSALELRPWSLGTACLLPRIPSRVALANDQLRIYLARQNRLLTVSPSIAPLNLAYY